MCVANNLVDDLVGSRRTCVSLSLDFVAERSIAAGGCDAHFTALILSVLQHK